MAKFKIPVPPKSTKKSILFPNELIGKVENAITDTECNFSKFVVEAVRVAIENLEEE